MFERALALEREGRDIVHLEIGRPHLDSPEPAKRAASEALERGAVHYTQNRGLPELREAIADSLGGRYEPQSEIVVTAGGSEAVAVAFRALLDAGEAAIVPTPAWPHYAPLIALAGARTHELPCPAEDGFLPDPERVAAAAREGARVLVLSSPSNPTGAVIGRERLEELARVCREHDLRVLSDEIYERFVYAGREHVSITTLEGMRERTVLVNSCSKTWSMTGWRVGWAAAPAEVAARINTVHQYLTVCAPTFAQWGAVAAIREGEPFVRSMVSEYDERRRALVSALAATPLELAEPGGAIYAFPRLPREDGDALAVRLLEEAGVATVPGSVFGASFREHVRISYGVAEAERERGLALLTSALRHGG